MAPVLERQRIEALDVVRGFALLGILGPNIVVFGWPEATMVDPALMGDGPGVQASHDIVSVFFLGKMMALFAMLFGAGVVIFDRKSVPGRPLSAGTGLWYRRSAWLLLFGLVHAIFFWFGDILVWYAINAMLLVWWLRRLDPKLQVALGVAGHALSTLLMVALSAVGVWALSQGKIPGGELMGSPATEIAAYTGRYLDALSVRMDSLTMMWLILGPLFVPGVTGLMLMGIGLTRMGVLTGEKSARFYGVLASVGLTVGLGGTSLLYFGLRHWVPEHSGFLWQSFSQFVGIPISLGYMATLVLLLKVGALRWLTAGLANIGRMAMSNYFAHTIICTSIFYGHGMGFFAKVPYPRLWLIVIGVWLFNFAFSALWLRWFRFGPFEWLWRSLTYWKFQPMRRAEVRTLPA